MPEPAAPSVVLVGMMGAGKTAVGQALAAATGWRYIDNDELVRAVTGREPEEIDASGGEVALHQAEAAALRRALTMPRPLIAAAAAWLVLDPDSVALLRATPAVVYLRARPETLRSRIGAGSGRREDATDLEWLRARSKERDASYRDVATFSIDTDDLSPADIAGRILEALDLGAADQATGG